MTKKAQFNQPLVLESTEHLKMTRPTKLPLHIKLHLYKQDLSSLYKFAAIEAQLLVNSSNQ